MISGKKTAGTIENPGHFVNSLKYAVQNINKPTNHAFYQCL